MKDVEQMIQARRYLDKNKYKGIGGKWQELKAMAKIMAEASPE